MWSDRQLQPEGDDYLELSSLLADPRQRRILSVLLDRSRPMTDRDLAVQLAARETDSAPLDISEEVSRTILIDLHHRCLPKLEAVGWIERHPEGVVATEQVSLGAVDSVPLDAQALEHGSWEAIGVLLARPRRQDLVTMLVDQGPRLTLEELANDLVECRHVSWATELRGEEPTLLIMLHHVDLPKLADVGVIEYDPDERTIVCNRSLTALASQTGLGDRALDRTD